MKDAIVQPIEEVWRHHCAALDGALTESIRGLENLLRVDEYHRHGHDPDQLERTLGPLAATHLDLGSLSRMLDRSARSRAMPTERLERIQSLIPALGEMKAVWSTAPLDAALAHIESGEDDVRTNAEAHLGRLARVFSALRIAQLEIRSKYEARAHDPVFADFDWRQLGPGELRLSPPFVVMAQLDGDDDQRLRRIMALLETGMPIKVVALRSSLQKVYSGPIGTTVPSKMTIETLPLAMRGVYFLQRSSVATDFQKQLSAALISPRPAVISILRARDDEAPEAFRGRAEGAVRSRAFPACVYDPDRNDRFVMCFDLSSNPSPDAVWSLDALTGRDWQDQPIQLEEPFTLAHFAAFEADLAAQLSDPPENADSLVPLTDYLALSRRQQLGKLPFIWLPGTDDAVIRKVVSPKLARQCAERLHLWRTLQEISGLDNPHVQTTRTTLQTELGAQQQAQMESLRAELERDAASRERAAVATAVRKLVARLTGTEP